MKFRVDGSGVVRLRIDEEFETERAATLAGLDRARYAAVKSSFQEAYEALSAINPDCKRSVRAIFDANEIAFKLMAPNAQRLAAPQLGQHLKPIVDAAYAGDATAGQASDKLLQSFTDWVASAQWYRHGQGQPEPTEPPLDIAILMVSNGAAFLRWLLNLDAAVQAVQH